jgi:hypothetical protein
MTKTYSVTGKGTFPWDMLRYDGSDYASEDERHIAEKGRGLRTVKLVLGNLRDEPCNDRWRSFRWNVNTADPKTFHQEIPETPEAVQTKLRRAQRSHEGIELIASMLDNVVKVAKSKSLQNMEGYIEVVKIAAEKISRQADLALDHVGAILESPEYTLSSAYEIVCSTPRNGGFDYIPADKANHDIPPHFRFEYADDIDAVRDAFDKADICYSFDDSEAEKSITVRL